MHGSTSQRPLWVCRASWALEVAPIAKSAVSLFRSPDPKWRPALVRCGWRRRVLRIGQLNSLLFVLGSRCLRLAIEIHGVTLIYDVDAIVICNGLGPAPGQKRRHRVPTGSSPPPPGIPESRRRLPATSRNLPTNGQRRDHHGNSAHHSISPSCGRPGTLPFDRYNLSNRGYCTFGPHSDRAKNDRPCSIAARDRS
jgi:hypothetical protein